MKNLLRKLKYITLAYIFIYASLSAYDSLPRPPQDPPAPAGADGSCPGLCVFNGTQGPQGPQGTPGGLISYGGWFMRLSDTDPEPRKSLYGRSK